MLNLLARNPWPSPNIPGVASDTTGCPERSEPRYFDSLLQQRQQRYRQGRLQPQHQQQPHRPLLLRQQQPELPLRPVGRRSAAGIQHHHADHRATRFAVLGQDRQLRASERSPSRLEPLRRRLLPRRPELQPSSPSDSTPVSRPITTACRRLTWAGSLKSVPPPASRATASIPTGTSSTTTPGRSGVTISSSDMSSAAPPSLSFRTTTSAAS